MGRQESCIYAKPTGFHGEELTCKRGNGKARISREIGAEIRELKLTSFAESEAL
jgi:hypothetical protein